MTRNKQAVLPVSKKWLVDGFCSFSRRMVAKQFDSFGVQTELLDLKSIGDETPIVVFTNHASWWDPISGMLIRKKYFPNRIFYAPIDSEALENYRIMAKLGFYGLQLKTTAGASEFLATTKLILKSKNATVWITPEGRFTDVRDHSQTLMPGLAHLASRVPGVVFIPMALEYAFWDESRPQLFARLGAAISQPEPPAQSSGYDKSEWSELLTSRLRQTQLELAQSVIARDGSRFDYLIASRPTRLGWYDYFRSWSARLKGKQFDPRHSRQD
jgi:1-acyl-sn-glycerol-3-phosphate acyltransferase